MKKLNSKGFTLVEVIAAVVILSVLMLLLVPSVNSLLQRSKNNSYKDLKQSFLLAAEEYVNDNRYNIDIDATGNVICIGSDIDIDVNGNVTCKDINDVEYTPNQITIDSLLSKGYLTPSGTDTNGEYIVDPRDKSKRLNLSSSYVKVNFDTTQKKYEYDVKDGYLSWN